MVEYYRPATGTAESEAVADALGSGTLSTGEIVEEFESEFADFCGRGQAAAVASGSVALEFALSASPLESGEGVLVSPFNCPAVLYAIVRAGYRPLFADIDPTTLALDADHVNAVLDESNDVAALLLTPSYGLAASFDELQSVAKSRDLVLITDFCQAPGAIYDGKPVGSYGDVGVCSFGATKNITTGEGGIVVGNDRYVDYAREARSNAQISSIDRPTSVRMSDIAATIGRVQLDKYPDLLATRRAAADAYRDTLPKEVVPQSLPDVATHVYHRFPVRVEKRATLVSFLDERKIPFSIEIETPLYEYDASAGSNVTNGLPGTETAVEETILLPIHSEIDASDTAAIGDEISSFYSTGFRRSDPPGS